MSHLNLRWWTFGFTTRDYIFCKYFSTPCIFLRLSLPSVINFFVITVWISCYSSGTLDSVLRFSLYFSILSSGSRSLLPPFFIFSEKLFFLVRCLEEMLGFIWFFDLKSNLKSLSLCQLSLYTYRLMTLLLLSKEIVFLEGERMPWTKFWELRSYMMSYFLVKDWSSTESSYSESLSLSGKR